MIFTTPERRALAERFGAANEQTSATDCRTQASLCLAEADLAPDDERQCLEVLAEGWIRLARSRDRPRLRLLPIGAPRPLLQKARS
jgi:hypothetical protein